MHDIDTQQSKLTSESLLHVLSASALVLFVTGLWVLNVHFSNYGFADRTLLRIDYVWAGFWAFFPVLIPILALETVRWISPKAKLWIKVLLFLFIYPGILYFLFFANQSMEWGFGGGVLIVSVLSLVLVAGATRDMLSGIIWEPLNRDTKSSLQWFDFRWFGFLLFWAFYITAFARIAYNDIPYNLGGGEPRPIQFVFEAKYKQVLTTSGLHVEDKGGAFLSEWVYLITDTDKTYVLHRKNEYTAIEIKKDIVSSIVYSKGYIESLRRAERK